MKKRILSLIMAFTLIPAGLFVPKAETALAASIKISSAKDLLAMEENPSGNYYLAKDITVPEDTCLFAGTTPFTGTLDGKGHKLKGYKSTGAFAIFANAKFAEFKNLSVSNVDIEVDGKAAALVCNADTCSFKDIEVSGKIVSGGDGGDVGAIVASGSGSMEKCKNSAKITAKTQKQGKSVGGLAGNFKATFLKNCSNSGAVTLTTGTDTYVFDSLGDSKVKFSIAGLVAGIPDKVTSCKNSGSVALNLKFKVDEKKSQFSDLANGVTVYAGGICQSASGPIVSSGNTGKIQVSSDKKTKVTGASYVGGVAAIGALGEAKWNDKVILSKCYNKGAVSFTGALNGKVGGSGCSWVGGLFGRSRTINQCYNKGKVTVSYLSGHTGVCEIGGISGGVTGSINHCYNIGNVAVTNKGKKKETLIRAGGLAGYADVLSSYGQKQGNASCSYAAGKITAPKDSRRGEFQGLLIGQWAGPFLVSKNLIYNNYYAGSGKAYGGGDTSWKPYMPTAKKVSAITSGNCPKLSSKYWSYSSKYRRMILKNNKE